MIKADKGEVKIEGNDLTLISELFGILKVLRTTLGDEYVDFTVEQSKKSDEEIHEEAEKAVENVLDLVNRIVKRW